MITFSLLLACFRVIKPRINKQRKIISQQQDPREFRKAIDQSFRDFNRFFGKDKTTGTISPAASSNASAPAKGKSPFDLVREAIEAEASRLPPANVTIGNELAI